MGELNGIDELAMKYGGAGTTVLHPIALVFILCMVVLVITLPRKWAIFPIVLTLFLIPLQQRIVIFSLDFMLVRIVLLFGLVRLILRSEIKYFKLQLIDNTVMLWITSNVISYTLLFQTVGAFINRMGFALDAIGVFLLFRCLVLDLDDIKRVIRMFAIVSLLVAIFMAIENITGRNFFSVFGGVPEFTVTRDGRMRCQGAFSHALNAGAFGASLMPLTLTLLGKDSKYRKLGIASFIASTIITVLSGSSNPILGYMGGAFVLCIWPWRRLRRKFLIVTSIAIVVTHFSMRAPVWALLGRAKIFSGSTGWHRYILVDRFIDHFNEWWLFGTKSTGHWGYGMWDVTNTYIHVGVNGGIFTLILFILILIFSFNTLGHAIELTRNIKMQFFYWAYIALLVAHSIMFLGMSYFDQIRLIWYMHIAMISTIKSQLLIPWSLTARQKVGV